MVDEVTAELAEELMRERCFGPVNEAHAASRERAARFGAPEGAEPLRCRACGLPVCKDHDDRLVQIGPTSCTRVEIEST